MANTLKIILLMLFVSCQKQSSTPIRSNDVSDSKAASAKIYSACKVNVDFHRVTYVVTGAKANSLTLNMYDSISHEQLISLPITANRNGVKDFEQGESGYNSRVFYTIESSGVELDRLYDSGETCAPEAKKIDQKPAVKK